MKSILPAFQRPKHEGWLHGYNEAMNQAPDIAKMEQLAAQGNRIAQYNLGVWLLNQSAGGQITEEAQRWLLGSAKQGFAPAQVALGSIFLKLRGQDYNPGRAAYWFEEASPEVDATISPSGRKSE